MSGNLNPLFTLTGGSADRRTFVVPANAGTHHLWPSVRWDDQTRKIPPCGGTFLLSRWARGMTLAIPLRGLLTTLTVRILLLLAGLRAAALLLAGLLVRILALLARLVLVRHVGISRC